MSVINSITPRRVRHYVLSLAGAITVALCFPALGAASTDTCTITVLNIATNVQTVYPGVSVPDGLTGQQDLADALASTGVSVDLTQDLLTATSCEPETTTTSTTSSASTSTSTSSTSSSTSTSSTGTTSPTTTYQAPPSTSTTTSGLTTTPLKTTSTSTSSSTTSSSTTRS